MTRPSAASRPFLTAQWRDLLMLNFAVDPELLRPLVPAGTQLDLWRGDALVSVVGFRFIDTRVLGVAVPWHRNFEEVNLRFYVKRHAPEGIRRAVVFIRELVPRRAIALVARAWYNEPYHALPMRHRREDTGDERTLRYEWRDAGQWTTLAARTTGASQSLVRGSEAEFITEHYWGYTRQRDGSTIEYQVAHPSWKVWQASDASLSGDLAPTYGHAFASVLSGPPQSAFVAEGSAVTVFRPHRLTPADLGSQNGR